MRATVWSKLVVAATPSEEGLRCELRDGRVVSFPQEWRKQISVTNRLYLAEGVTAIDRTTAVHLERDSGPDLAQIPTLAACPPKQNRYGQGVLRKKSNRGLMRHLPIGTRDASRRESVRQ